MKVNSKVLGILILLLIAVTISAVSAIEFTNFSMNVPAGCNFSDQSTTNLSVDEIALDLMVYENTGNNSKDISSVIYFKNSYTDKNMTANFVNDLKSGSEVVAENDKYTIVKFNNSTVKASNITDNASLDEVFDFANSLIPGDDGMNISLGGNSLSLSNDSFEIGEAGGDNISITSKGIEFSSGDNSSQSAKISFSDDITPYIKNDDYVACLTHDNEVIIIGGDNLALIKQMASSVKFN